MKRQTFLKLTGLSPARLQNWTEAGILHPATRPGRPHNYTLRDAIRAGFILEILARGFSLATAENLSRRVADPKPPPPDTVALITGRSQTKGQGRVHMEAPRVEIIPEGEALKHLTQQPGPWYLIKVGELAADLRRRYRRSK